MGPLLQAVSRPLYPPPMLDEEDDDDDDDDYEDRRTSRTSWDGSVKEEEDADYKRSASQAQHDEKKLPSAHCMDDSADDDQNDDILSQVRTLQAMATEQQSQDGDDDPDGTSQALHYHEEAVGLLLWYAKRQDSRESSHVPLLTWSLECLVQLHLQRGEPQSAVAALEGLMDTLRHAKELTESDAASHDNHDKSLMCGRLADACLRYSTLLQQQQQQQQQQDEHDYSDTPTRTTVMIQQALQEALQLRLQLYPSTHTKVLQVIQLLGRFKLQGDQDLEGALQCFETILHAQSSREDTSLSQLPVAHALLDVAHVLERQDNGEGAMDLYQEALLIYDSCRGSMGNDDDDIHWKRTQVHCRMGNILLTEGHVDEAVAELELALSPAQKDVVGSRRMDQAKVYHSLGRAYMEQERFVEARQYLLKSADLLKREELDREDSVNSSFLLLEEERKEMDIVVPASSTMSDALLGEVLIPTTSDTANRSSPSSPRLTVHLSVVDRSGKTPEPAKLPLSVLMDGRSQIVAVETVMSGASEAKAETDKAMSFERGGSPSSFVEFNPFGSPSQSPNSRHDVVDFDPYTSPSLPSPDRSNSGFTTTVLSIDTRQAIVDVSELGSPLSNSSSNDSFASRTTDKVLLPSFEETQSPHSLQSSSSKGSEPTSLSFAAVRVRLADRRGMSSLDITDEGIETSLQLMHTAESDEFKSAESEAVSCDEDQEIDVDEDSMYGHWTSDYSGYESHGDPELTDYESGSESDGCSVSDKLESEAPNDTKTLDMRTFEAAVDSHSSTPVKPTIAEGLPCPSSTPASVISSFAVQIEESASDKVEPECTQPAETSPSQTRQSEASVPSGPRQQEVEASQFSPSTVSSRPLLSLATTMGSDKLTIETIQPPSPQTPRKRLNSDRIVTKHSPRQRIAKALSSRFRRRRVSKSQLESMPEDGEHLPDTSGTHRTVLVLGDDAQRWKSSSCSTSSSPGPITFISTESSPSGDDSVSQITYNSNEFETRPIDKFWWESTYEAVVDVAEQFLSAESIHDNVKSRRSEWGSVDLTDEESDPFDDISDDDTQRNKNEAKNSTPRSPESHSFASAALQWQSPMVHTKRSGRKSSFHGEEDKTQGLSKSSARGMSSTGRVSPRTRSNIALLHSIWIQQKEKFGPKSSESAEALIQLALAHRQARELSLAVQYLLEALRVRKSIGDGREIARSLHMLADTYCEQKHFRSALAYFLDVQWIEKSLYGDSHPELANTLNKMGRVHAARHEFDVAMQCHQEALQVLNTCLGDDLSHPAVIETLIRIGEVYYKERNSLATIRSKSDDYNTFIETGMLDVIARAHETRGNYRMSISFQEEKLQLMNNGSSDHTLEDLASTLTGLGTVSCKAGVYLEAIDYYDQSLKIQTKLGCDEVQLAKARVMTATVDYHLSQYKKALGLFQNALEILRNNLGSDNLAVAECLQRIGLVQIKLFDYDAAAKALEESFDTQEKLVGPDDPSALRTRLELGNVLMSRCEFDEAIDGFSDVLERQRCIFGRKHPDMALTLFYIGRAYEWNSDAPSAMNFYEASFRMGEEFLGRDHPAQASTLHRIAVIHGKLGRNRKALQLCERVLGMRKETQGERHIEVAMTLSSLGECLTALSRFKDALNLYEESILVAEEAVGATHPSVGEIIASLGGLQLKQCNFAEAKESIERALEIYQSFGISDKHPLLKEARAALQRVEHDEMLCV